MTFVGFRPARASDEHTEDRKLFRGSSGFAFRCLYRMAASGRAERPRTGCVGLAFSLPNE